MTRSNIHIKLTNGQIVQCVADSSSAPEQGWIVETVIIPLLALNDADRELELLTKWCTLNEQRVNAVYRYIISLPSKTVHFFEENYSCSENRFYLGENITHRYDAYIASHNALGQLFNDINQNPL